MGLNWVWCGICAKYLAFGTYPTSAVGALMHSSSSPMMTEPRNSHLLHHFFFLSSRNLPVREDYVSIDSPISQNSMRF